MRRKPDFKPDSSQKPNKENDSLSCLWMFFVLVGGYFVITAINRVLSGNGNILDHMICYGVLIGFVILVILAKREEDQDKKKLREAQQDWKHTCRSAEVAIVNREYCSGTWEDEYGIIHSSRYGCKLNLELTAEQRVLFPNLQSVRVTVDENIYSKLIDRYVVRIYYKPDSPMDFLLEEEIE